MPHTSAFTPCGQFKLSSQLSHAQRFYDQLSQLLNASAYGNDQAFDLVEGEHLEAHVYATARGLGRHCYMLERAGNQSYPNRSMELLPLLEYDFQLIPGAKDDYIARQKALAAAELTTRGAIRSNVVNGLKALLGANFLAYVPAPAQTTYPSSPGAGPGLFLDPRVPTRLLALVDPVATTGTWWCAYQNFDTTAAPVSLVPGDRVVVGAGNTSQAETVTVLQTAFSPPSGSLATANQPPSGASSWVASASYSTGQYVTPTAANANGLWFLATSTGTSGLTEPAWPTQFGVQVSDGGVNWIAAGASTVFRATFANSHDIGAPIVAGNWPYWWSTRRQSLIVVTAFASTDRDSIRKVNTFMSRVARGPSTWAIVVGTPARGTNGGTTGGVSAGAGMGTASLGSFSYTNSY